MNKLNFDNFKQHENRHKCKCCGGEIVYDNTCIGDKGKIKGKSYLTEKVVNDVPYKLQVCQKCLLKKFPDIKNLSRTFNVMSEPTKFAFDIPDDVYESSRSKYAMTLNHMIEKYGEEEGNKRWNEYCDKQSETNTFEYKQKVYGWTKEQFDEYNQLRAATLENLINRYGEEEGNKRWNEYVDRQKYTKSKEYMVNKFGYDGWVRINKLKAITLDNFIRKYGEEEGNKRWNEYVKKMIRTYSKSSQKFFDELDQYLNNNYTTYYATKNTEISRGKYRLDYYIKELNICIEFNGDNWHGNPNKFCDDIKCHPYDKNLTAKDLQIRDKIRNEFLFKNFGIKTFVVWESDYNKNFDVKKFITDILKIKLD